MHQPYVEFFMEMEAQATSGAGGADKADERALTSGSMLEHPVFVYWCTSCGREPPAEAGQCSHCWGRVQRHQRVLELPDERDDDGPLSLRSLRAALADVSAGEDVASSAVLLFEQGPDPEVAMLYPTLAEELASLGVPPAVQRALVDRGFINMEQITAAVTSTPPVEAGIGIRVSTLGLSPAAEVLLRRLWHVAMEERSIRRARANSRSGVEKRLKVDEVSGTCVALMCGMTESVDTSGFLTEPAAFKRMKAPHSSNAAGMMEEMGSDPWQLQKEMFLDEQMRALHEHEESDEDYITLDDEDHTGCKWSRRR